MMTTAEAAKLLNLDVSRIRQLCINGKLKASKRGRDWWITKAEVERFAALSRPAGRPRKQKGANS